MSCLGSCWRQHPVGVGECCGGCRGVCGSTKNQLQTEAVRPVPCGVPCSWLCPCHESPSRTPLLASVGKGGRCEQETRVKPGWQCWHPGGSRAPQPALVWGLPEEQGCVCTSELERASVCTPSLRSGGLAFSGNRGRQADGAIEAFGGQRARPPWAVCEGLERSCRVVSPCSWPPLPMLSKGWHRASWAQSPSAPRP